MKKIILILLTNVLLLHGGTPINDFKLKDLDNRYVSFSDLQGEKLTIIDFWATWCKPCLQAIPKLNAIYEQYENQGLVIVGINTDSPRNAAKVKPFVKAYKINYPVLRDPNSELAGQLNVSSYPTLYIVNSQREIVFTHIGFRPGDEILLVAEIEKLLGHKDE